MQARTLFPLVGAGAVVLWLLSGSMKPRAAAPTSPGDRAWVADLIIARAMAEGWSEKFGQALVVNAWHESRLDPDAIGDNGASVGLFQLHENGLGRGLTTAQRQDPDVNVGRVLSEALDTKQLVDADAAGASVPELAGLVATYIEKCVGCQAGGSERAAREATARAWYPEAA